MKARTDNDKAPEIASCEGPVSNMLYHGGGTGGTEGQKGCSYIDGNLEHMDMQFKFNYWCFSSGSFQGEK